MFCVKDAIHLILVDDEYRGWYNRDSRPHSLRLTCKAAFTEKITRSKHRYDGFFAALIEDAKLHSTVLNIQDMPGDITLRENSRVFPKFDDLSRHTSRIEKSLNIESGLLLEF